MYMYMINYLLLSSGKMINYLITLNLGYAFYIISLNIPFKTLIQTNMVVEELHILRLCVCLY